MKNKSSSPKQKPFLKDWISLYEGGTLAGNLSFFKEWGVGSYTKDSKDMAGKGSIAPSPSKKGLAKQAVTGKTQQPKNPVGARGTKDKNLVPRHKRVNSLNHTNTSYPGMETMNHEGEFPMVEANGRKWVLAEDHSEAFEMENQDDMIPDDMDLGTGFEDESGDLEQEEGEEGQEQEFEAEEDEAIDALEDIVNDEDMSDKEKVEALKKEIEKLRDVQNDEESAEEDESEESEESEEEGEEQESESDEEEPSEEEEQTEE